MRNLWFKPRGALTLYRQRRQAELASTEPEPAPDVTPAVSRPDRASLKRWLTESTETSNKRPAS